MNGLFKTLRKAPTATIAFSVVWIVTIFRALSIASGEWERTLPLLLLAVATAWNVFSKHRNPTHILLAKSIAWVMLLLAPIALLLPTTDVTTVLFLQVWAVCVFSLGLRSGAWMGIPLALCLLIIPYQEQLSLFFSYPLRLISTIISAETLLLFGCNIQYDLTTITVGTSKIAITDACSGITQLEVLLLLCYLVVLRQHRSTLWRGLHYLCMLPVIIAVNSFRLIVTVLLFFLIGTKAFDDFWHVSLGYLLVICVVLIFWWIGALFPQNQEDKQ